MGCLYILFGPKKDWFSFDFDNHFVDVWDIVNDDIDKLVAFKWIQNVLLTLVNNMREYVYIHVYAYTDSMHKRMRKEVISIYYSRIMIYSDNNINFIRNPSL